MLVISLKTRGTCLHALLSSRATHSFESLAVITLYICEAHFQCNYSSNVKGIIKV